MRGDIKSTLKSLTNDQDFDWRGLENIRSGTMLMVRESQQTLVRGVMAMLKMHKKLGLRDDQSVALFVQAYNKEATQRANAEAIRVHKEIKSAIDCVSN